MRNPNEPIEPEMVGTERGSRFDDPDAASIPVVDPDDLAGHRSHPVDPVRCNLATAARTLASLGRGRIVVITPDDEPNTGCAVALARNLVSVAPTVVVDMAHECRTSIDMGVEDDLPGLKDVLSGNHKLSACVHPDAASRAMVVPCGRADTELTAASGAMLPVILDALAHAYPFLILDAGGADAQALSRIADESAGLIIATEDASADTIKDRVQNLRRAGFDEPVIVTGD